MYQKEGRQSLPILKRWMTLTATQLAQYDREGFLVLKDFAPVASCDALRTRAEELVHDFEPNDIVAIFSTREQNRRSDDYFLNSGDKIRFFFEEDAFHPDGTLKQSKEQSINKIGHALHDLDPVFNEFSRNPAVAQNSLKRSEEHTSELQSLRHLVCRLLLEKKNMILIADSV